MANRIKLEAWEEQLAAEGDAIRRMRQMDAGSVGNLKGARTLRVKATMRRSYVATLGAKRKLGLVD